MIGKIKVPIEKGRKILTWNVGVAVTNGSGQVNPIVSLRTDKDADFVARRGFLVQYPSFGAAQDPNLALPATAVAVLRDGATKYPLSLVAVNPTALMLNADVNRAVAMEKGFSSAWILRANSNVFIEIANPLAGTTPWVGDCYLVLEGFNIYPGQQELVPATIEAYALPDYGLAGVFSLPDPSVGTQALQINKITNQGLGRVLAKGLRLQFTDAAAVDQTAKILPALGVQISDSTSGKMPWVRNSNAQANVPAICPASVMTYGNSFVNFNTPRLLDENANLEVTTLFHQAALTWLAGASGITWPVSMSFNLIGDMLPK